MGCKNYTFTQQLHLHDLAPCEGVNLLARHDLEDIWTVEHPHFETWRWVTWRQVHSGRSVKMGLYLKTILWHYFDKTFSHYNVKRLSWNNVIISRYNMINILLKREKDIVIIINFSRNYVILSLFFFRNVEAIRFCNWVLQVKGEIFSRNQVRVGNQRPEQNNEPILQQRHWQPGAVRVLLSPGPICHQWFSELFFCPLPAAESSEKRQDDRQMQN